MDLAAGCGCAEYLRCINKAGGGTSAAGLAGCTARPGAGGPPCLVFVLQMHCTAAGSCQVCWTGVASWALSLDAQGKSPISGCLDISTHLVTLATVKFSPERTELIVPIHQMYLLGECKKYAAEQMFSCVLPEMLKDIVNSEIWDIDHPKKVSPLMPINIRVKMVSILG